ncbi:MAG: glycosyltransferase [Deltaproteobacteria bacterium]
MAIDRGAASLTKDEEPVCSICIANYNGGKLLETCLDSVFQQDFPYPLEVIVHDDASTDGSVDIVIAKFPQVHLMRSDSNVGFCVSNNRMVASATGKYILLLNNDAQLHQDAISTLYNFAAGEKINGIIGLPQHDMPTDELIDIGSLFDLFLNPIPNLKMFRRNVGMVSGACMWLPRKLWDELGGFPEWFESVAEDAYLCCLARLRGYPVIALAKAGFRHWVGRSLGGGKVVQKTLQTTYRRRALSERNKSYVMLLCYPAPVLQFIFPLHLLFILGEGVILSMLKRDPLIWKKIYEPCFKSLWYERKRIARERQSVQKGRVITVRQFFRPFRRFPHKIKLLCEHGSPVIR